MVFPAARHSRNCPDSPAAPGRAFCPAWGAWMFRVGRRCPVVPIWELEPIPRPAFALACRFPPLEPSPKRLLRLTRSTTRQETLHADVFRLTLPIPAAAAMAEATPASHQIYAPPGDSAR